MAERKFNTDQSRTENTLSTNRQSDLEMEYKDDFRDGARVDAIDKIEAKLTKPKKRGKNSISDQLKAYRLACLIFEVKKTRKHMKGPLKSQEFIHISSQPTPSDFLFSREGILPTTRTVIVDQMSQMYNAYYDMEKKYATFFLF